MEDNEYVMRDKRSRSRVSKPTVEDLRFLEKYYGIKLIDTDRAIIQYDGIIWQPICSYSNFMSLILEHVTHFELEGFLFVPFAWTPCLPKISYINSNSEENE